MSTNAYVNYSNSKLEPAFDSSKARERSVNIAVSQTIAAGTVLGELTGTNAVQTVTLTSATGGTFTLTFGGLTTASVAYNCTAATLQAALQALGSIGAGNVHVTGSAGGPYTLTFVEVLGNQVVGSVTASNTLLTGSGHAIAVVNTTPGVGVGSGVFAPYNDANEDGTDTAKGIAIYDCSTDADGNLTVGSLTANVNPMSNGFTAKSVPIYVSGVFETDDLTGFDAAALADLVGRFESGNANDNINSGGIVRFA